MDSRVKYRKTSICLTNKLLCVILQ